MIVDQHEEPEHLADIRDYISNDWAPLFENRKNIDNVLKYLDDLKNKDFENSLKSYKTFVPPRLVAAAKLGNVTPFFGAGVSIAAGIPTWAGLLQKLGVSDDLAQEPNLEHDPLTLAELLAHEIGYLELQKELRALMVAHTTPSIVHYLLAQLSQGVYVTTNYDTLFETAWKKLNEHPHEPMVVTTDSDFSKYSLDPKALSPENGNIVLLKIHGCASRHDEELILTRSQYRRHYRTNTVLFDAVRDLMLQKHMLFMGFSHRDPEITRLVDDAIHKYENSNSKAPEYYSLQFDMKEKTPEVFAARGMLALRPPVSLDVPDGFDYRTAGLSKALVDICAAMDSDVHKTLDIDNELHNCVNVLETELAGAMTTILNVAKDIAQDINNIAYIQSLLYSTLSSLGSLSGQGIYFLKKNGDISVCAIPKELGDPKRTDKRGLSKRFYVQQAKTFKEAFISDSDKSKFNEHSTVFLCAPLGSKTNYEGMLFCATQIGEWKTPIIIKETFLAKHPDSSFILVDSNGVVLLPPNNEFDIQSPKTLPKNESGKGNQGYNYDSLHRISRRDRLITRIWRNIVPIYQDDDVYNFSDLGMYSVVTEVKGTRWKLALSKPIPKS